MIKKDFNRFLDNKIKSRFLDIEFFKNYYPPYRNVPKCYLLFFIIGNKI